MDDYADTYHVWHNTVRNPLTYGIFFMLAFCVGYCIYNHYKAKQEARQRDGLAVDLYGHLAKALAKLHNKDPNKVARERVENGVGVGVHPDNINEWVTNMWHY